MSVQHQEKRLGFPCCGVYKNTNRGKGHTRVSRKAKPCPSFVEPCPSFVNERAGVFPTGRECKPIMWGNVDGLEKEAGWSHTSGHCCGNYEPLEVFR